MYKQTEMLNAALSPEVCVIPIDSSSGHHKDCRDTPCLEHTLHNRSISGCLSAAKYSITAAHTPVKCAACQDPLRTCTITHLTDRCSSEPPQLWRRGSRSEESEPATFLLILRSYISIH